VGFEVGSHFLKKWDSDPTFCDDGGIGVIGLGMGDGVGDGVGVGVGLVAGDGVGACAVSV